MPGPAPAKVQHWAARMRISTGQEYTPVWDEDKQTWVLTIPEHVECSDFLHGFLKQMSGECYHECTDGHSVEVVLSFRRGPWSQGVRRWRMRAVATLDGDFEEELDPSMIASLLAKPTNPKGEGKAHQEAPGSNKQQMSVKKTTVIRV